MSPRRRRGAAASRRRCPSCSRPMILVDEWVNFDRWRCDDCASWSVVCSFCGHLQLGREPGSCASCGRILSCEAFEAAT